jgi:flagellar biosynthesis/type III secretory pathway M-ring protein FliF/YscJ
MTMFIQEDFGWYFLQQLLEWVLIVTAFYFGARLVRAYEIRSQPRTSQQALHRRVRELEEQAEELGAQVRQLLEADRFASALLLRRGGADREWKAERVERRADERIG